MPSDYPNLRALAEQQARYTVDPSCHMLARALLAALDRVEASRNSNPNRVEAGASLAALEEEAERA